MLGDGRVVLDKANPFGYNYMALFTKFIISLYRLKSRWRLAAH